MRLVIGLVLAVLVITSAPTNAFDLRSLKKGAAKAVKKLPKPTANLKDVDITSISFTDIHFLFTVAIKNPYPIGINLDKVTCTFSLEKIPVFTARTAGGLKVPAKRSKDTKIDVGLAFKKIMEAAKAYTQTDRVDLKLAGEIVVAVPGHKQLPGVPASIAFPYSVTRAVPTIKPSVIVRNVKVEVPSARAIAKAIAASARPQLNAASVQQMYTDLFAGRTVANAPVDYRDLDLVFNTSFDVELKNETPAALLFKSLDYGFAINGEKALSGKTTEIVTQGAVSLIKVKSGLSSRSLGGAVVSAFQDRKANYTLSGLTFINLPAIKKDPLKLDFAVDGKVDF